MEGMKNFRMSFQGFLIEIAIRKVAMVLFYPVQILKILNPIHHIIPKIPANNQIAVLLEQQYFKKEWTIYSDFYHAYC